MISVEDALKQSFTEMSDIRLDVLVSTMDETNTKSWHLVLKNLLRISLFQSLIPEKLVELLQKLSQYNVSSLVTDLEHELPRKIVGNDVTMDWLEMCTRRIEHMQVPRYAKLKEILAGFMQKFISKEEKNRNRIEEENAVYSLSTDESLQPDKINNVEAFDSEEIRLKKRYQKLQSYIDNLPWNVSKRKKLKEFGYHQNFWCKTMKVIEVETDGTLNLDENLRQSLLSCYSEYVEILNRLDISSICVDGETVKTGDIFTDELALPYLKGRRSIVLKVQELYLWDHVK